jgi:biotin operon repressor
MAFLKYIERYQNIDRLIRMENTGSPAEFSKKLGISESHLYFCLKELKEYGLPIVYSNYKRTYYYSEAVKLIVDVSIENMANDEIINISGGNIKNVKIFASLLYNQSGGLYFSSCLDRTLADVQ